MTRKPSPLGSKVKRLLRQRNKPRALQVWGALMGRERKAAGEALLRSHPDVRETLVELIAHHLKYRPPTVRKLSDEKVAGHMMRVSPESHALAAELILTHFRYNHRAMVTEFLDAAGIAHTDGVVEDEDDNELSPEDFVLGAHTISEKFNDRDVALYLLAAGSGHAPLAPYAHAWLRTQHQLDQASGRAGGQPISTPAASEERGTDARDSHQEAGSPDDKTTGAPDDDMVEVAPTVDPATPTVDDSREATDDPAVSGAEEELDEDIEEDDEPSRHVRRPVRILTPLDHLLIDSAFNIAEERAGSLSKAQLGDAVDELIKLNGQRPQSYFHAGFMEGLHSDQVSDGIPVEDPARLRWFWAGVIHGWARRQRWPCIVKEYQSNQVIQALGDGLDSASQEVVRSVVKALVKQRHSSETANFVSVNALLRVPELHQDLLDIATSLLRGGDAAIAKPVFDLLNDASTRLDERGQPLDSQIVLLAHRRTAHCLRMLGAHTAAKRLLSDLLERDPDPNIHAMVHADLGIIEGGFDDLEEIALPERAEELDNFLERLERGAVHFRESVQAKTEYSAHGHYCLGVLGLGRAVQSKSFDEPEADLQMARVRFSKRNREYADDLVHRADLYLGIAKTQRIDPAKMAHAAGVITRALEGGARFPAYLINDTLDALDLGDKADLRAVSEALLGAGGNSTLGDSILEEMAECEPALDHCPTLSRRLFERSGDETHRSAEERAKDARAALGGFLNRRDFAQASEALDRLQVLAHNGAGVNRFIQLLTDHERLSPVWDREDAAIARAHCLAAQENYVDATNVLRNLFHHLAAKFNAGSYEALADAEGILDLFRQYGIHANRYKGETKRLEGMRESESEQQGPLPETDQKPLVVRVLVVGGAESQSNAAEKTIERVRRKDPNIRVKLIPTGWKSGWMDTFMDVKTHMDNHDGLVLLRFMRTNFGRKVREEWSKPHWRFCWSGGPSAIANTVVTVADLVRGSRGRSGSALPTR